VDGIPGAYAPRLAGPPLLRHGARPKGVPIHRIITATPKTASPPRAPASNSSAKFCARRANTPTKKGIIHRDIKNRRTSSSPRHDGTPVVKVIDFGVAKANWPNRLTDKSVYTNFSQFIGTPASTWSPEQSGPKATLDIDTRTDIYAPRRSCSTNS